MTEISAYMKKHSKKLELPIFYIDDLPEPLIPCISYEFDQHDENLIFKLAGIQRMVPDEPSRMVFNISESPIKLDNLTQNSSISVVIAERRNMIRSKMKSFFKKNPLFVSLLIPDEYKRQLIPFKIDFKRSRNYFYRLRNRDSWFDKDKGISEWHHFFDDCHLTVIRKMLDQ
jgi:hypothetical protein